MKMFQRSSGLDNNFHTGPLKRAGGVEITKGEKKENGWIH